MEWDCRPYGGSVGLLPELAVQLHAHSLAEEREKEREDETDVAAFVMPSWLSETCSATSETAYAESSTPILCCRDPSMVLRAVRLVVCTCLHFTP